MLWEGEIGHRLGFTQELCLPCVPHDTYHLEPSVLPTVLPRPPKLSTYGTGASGQSLGHGFVDDDHPRGVHCVRAQKGPTLEDLHFQSFEIPRYHSCHRGPDEFVRPLKTKLSRRMAREGRLLGHCCGLDPRHLLEPLYQLPEEPLSLVNGSPHATGADVAGQRPFRVEPGIHISSRIEGSEDETGQKEKNHRQSDLNRDQEVTGAQLPPSGP